MKVVGIRRENSSGGFSERNDDRVNGGTAPSTSSQERGASCEWFGDRLVDVASLEESILNGIAAGMAFQTFHENN